MPALGTALTHEYTTFAEALFRGPSCPSWLVLLPAGLANPPDCSRIVSFPLVISVQKELSCLTLLTTSPS